MIIIRKIVHNVVMPKITTIFTFFIKKIVCLIKRLKVSAIRNQLRVTNRSRQTSRFLTEVERGNPICETSACRLIGVVRKQISIN